MPHCALTTAQETVSHKQPTIWTVSTTKHIHSLTSREGILLGGFDLFFHHNQRTKQKTSGTWGWPAARVLQLFKESNILGQMWPKSEIFWSFKVPCFCSLMYFASIKVKEWSVTSKKNPLPDWLNVNTNTKCLKTDKSVGITFPK